MGWLIWTQSATRRLAARRAPIRGAKLAFRPGPAYRAAMQNILLIGAGGALGAVSRHLVGRTALRLLGGDQPWGTLAVNVAGGLMMGLLIGFLVATERGDQHAARMFAAVGFLGGFTTFSAFSLEMALMIERKAWLNAFAYAAGSVVLSLGALMIGMYLVRKAVS
jgi:CrcB protein